MTGSDHVLIIEGTVAFAGTKDECARYAALEREEHGRYLKCRVVVAWEHREQEAPSLAAAELGWG